MSHGYEKSKQGSTKMNDSESEIEDGIYEVERILNHKSENGQMFYLLKWKGYAEKESTWESLENLDCYDLIEQYILSAKDKPHQYVGPGLTDSDKVVITGLSVIDNQVVYTGHGRNDKQVVLTSSEAKTHYLKSLINFLESKFVKNSLSL